MESINMASDQNESIGKKEDTLSIEYVYFYSEGKIHKAPIANPEELPESILEIISG